jgi:DNA-binding transcriptional regulator GbsR (MarR family)
MLQSERHDLGSRPLSEIAKQLKVSRAIMSFHVRSLEEQLGFFHARGQKAVEARESYKTAVKAGWQTRREKHGETGRKPSLHPEQNAKRKAVTNAENLTN